MRFKAYVDLGCCQDPQKAFRHEDVVLDKGIKPLLISAANLRNAW